MSKHLVRLMTLLLVPCLWVDPSTASGLHEAIVTQPNHQGLQNELAINRIQQEAFSPRALPYLATFAGVLTVAIYIKFGHVPRVNTSLFHGILPAYLIQTFSTPYGIYGAAAGVVVIATFLTVLLIRSFNFKAPASLFCNTQGESKKPLTRTLVSAVEMFVRDVAELRRSMQGHTALTDLVDQHLNGLWRYSTGMILSAVLSIASAFAINWAPDFAIAGYPHYLFYVITNLSVILTWMVLTPKLESYCEFVLLQACQAFNKAGTDRAYRRSHASPETRQANDAYQISLNGRYLHLANILPRSEGLLSLVLMVFSMVIFFLFDWRVASAALIYTFYARQKMKLPLSESIELTRSIALNEAKLTHQAQRVLSPDLQEYFALHPIHEDAAMTSLIPLTAALRDDETKLHKVDAQLQLSKQGADATLRSMILVLGLILLYFTHSPQLAKILALVAIAESYLSHVEKFFDVTQGLHWAAGSLDRLNQILNTPERISPQITLTNGDVFIENAKYQYATQEGEKIATIPGMKIESGRIVLFRGQDEHDTTALRQVLDGQVGSLEGVVQIGGHDPHLLAGHIAVTLPEAPLVPGLSIKDHLGDYELAKKDLDSIGADFLVSPISKTELDTVVGDTKIKISPWLQNRTHMAEALLEAIRGKKILILHDPFRRFAKSKEGTERLRKLKDALVRLQQAHGTTILILTTEDESFSSIAGQTYSLTEGQWVMATAPYESRVRETHPVDPIPLIRNLTETPPRILCLTGPGLEGKAALVRKLVQSHPDRYFLIPQVKTRNAYRDEEYDTDQFISDDEFNALLEKEDIILEGQREDENFRYGIYTSKLREAVLSGKVIVTDSRRISDKIADIWSGRKTGRRVQIKFIAILPRSKDMLKTEEGLKQLRQDLKNRISNDRIDRAIRRIVAIRDNNSSVVVNMEGITDEKVYSQLESKANELFVIPPSPGPETPDKSGRLVLVRLWTNVLTRIIWIYDFLIDPFIESRPTYLTMDQARARAVEIIHRRDFAAFVVPLGEILLLPGVPLFLLPWLGWAAIPAGAVIVTLLHGLPWLGRSPPPRGFQSARQFALRFVGAFGISGLSLLPVLLNFHPSTVHLSTISTFISFWKSVTAGTWVSIFTKGYLAHALWNSWVPEYLWLNIDDPIPKRSQNISWAA